MTPARSIATISNALDAALDFAAQRADADDGVPNPAMTLCTEIEQAQAALEELRKESCPACSDQPVTFGR